MAQVNESRPGNSHLRNEISYRWPYLSTVDVDECCADQAKLIDVLQSRYGYSKKIAEKEACLFLGEFQNRLRMAA